jgi:hypothetical protein
MTITLTSQVELKSEAAASRDSLAGRYGPLHENHMPLPPLRPFRAATTHQRPGEPGTWV